MMKNIIFSCLVLFLVPGSGCHRDFSVDLSGRHKIIDRPASSLEKTVAGADNRFGIKLFRQLNSTTGDSNLFISPFSVSMALGMTLNGAAGETEQAMRQTLELTGLTQEEINATYQSLMALLSYQDREVLLEIANSIWPKAGYPILPEFLETNQTFFDAVVREMDFTNPEALDIINGWISDKTHGKIENALDEIPRNIVMYLINAIYFKGNWATAFDPEKTYETPFNSPAGPVTCEMMNRHDTFMYFQTGDFQAVDLPYGDGKFSMSVFLPAEGRTADDLITAMTHENWQQWIQQFNETEMDLGLPKFKVEYGILLNDALAALGMSVAFGDQADFSRINPQGDLFISRVIHKTFVEVNELGTEAAAVTIVEFFGTSVGMSMFINRPFVFVIWDHNTGAILFMGKIVEPLPV